MQAVSALDQIGQALREARRRRTVDDALIEIHRRAEIVTNLDTPVNQLYHQALEKENGNVLHKPGSSGIMRMDSLPSREVTALDDSGGYA
jgi:hypothetical protein